jgi:acid phosphatase (class A)
MDTDLQALAWRIARNREIAGLHYPSDSAAGEQLATDILPYLQNTNEYQTVIPIARQEWL